MIFDAASEDLKDNGDGEPDDDGQRDGYGYAVPRCSALKRPERVASTVLPRRGITGAASPAAGSPSRAAPTIPIVVEGHSRTARRLHKSSELHCRRAN